MTTTKELTAPAVTGEPTPAPAPPPSLASRITKGRRVSPRRLTIYGTGGMGKSTLASEAPNPIFIPTEDGLRDIDCNAYPICKSYHDVFDTLDDLSKDAHGYKTVVIDSLDWLEPLIWKEVCQKNGNRESIEKFPYGEGYKLAVDKWRILLARLDDLRLRHGMHVILIAHAQIKRFENPETEAYERYQLKLQHAANTSAMSVVIEWSDEVLFAGQETFTRSEKISKDNTRNIGFGSGKRILRCTEQPFCVAKNRLGMPDSIPFEKGKGWAEYAKWFPQNQVTAS